MATYAIGDIQGCFDSLQALLAQIRFHPVRDRLWLVGDLVNRGPRSLQVLRWARDLGDSVVAVLGNHDLYLLLRAVGASRKKKRDTLDKVLNARDGAQLIAWLRHRPLMHVESGVAMVHAGLLPSWTIADALARAGEVAALLRADDWRMRIHALSLGTPAPQPHAPDPLERVRATASVMVRIRTCTAAGVLCEDLPDTPDETPPDCVPWFSVPDARWRDHQVIFGHWSALGLHVDEHTMGLDTGCVWGGQLTAVRLEDRAIFQVPAVEPPMD